MREQRGDAALALALVSAVTVAGVGRLFADGGWILPAALAVAGAHGTGLLTRRWPGGRAVLAHAAALGALLTATVGPGRLVVALGDALRAFRAAIVPAPTTPELILWTVAGTWICVAVADRLARRRPLGLAAVLPLAVIHVVVTVLGTDRSAALSSFAFAAAVTFYAVRSRTASLPRGHARVLIPAPGAAPPARNRPRPVLTGAGAALVAGTATLILGPIVPGAASEPLVDVHALRVAIDVSRVGLNPLVDIRRSLLDGDDAELFTVRSTAPAYWRLTALDRFDGNLWTVSRPALHRRGQRASADGAGGEPLRQEFRILALDTPWLPAAHRVLGVGSSGARLDPDTESLVTRRGSQDASSYHVDSRPAHGDPIAGAVMAPTDLARYLDLPGDFPPAVEKLARRLTASASSPQERAYALQDNMRLLYDYDTSVPPGHSHDALARFLFERRAGYCEQFAGAYAAMARSVGLPARVAVGFIPGSYEVASDLWHVRSRDAHAWPEVYLEGSGWTAFEPTPGRVPTIEGGGRDGGGASGASAAGAAPRAPSALRRVLTDLDGGVDAGPGGRPNRSGVPAWWWLVASVGGLGLLLSPGAKLLVRQARRSGRPAVPAAWREALDRLAETGLRPVPAETPLEFAGRVSTTRPPAARPVTRLATLVSGYAYGRGGSASDDAAAWSEVSRLRGALDEGEPMAVRVVRRLDPRPLLRLARRALEALPPQRHRP
jgi:transglutaminase-like putative cysteine protease